MASPPPSFLFLQFPYGNMRYISAQGPAEEEKGYMSKGEERGRERVKYAYMRWLGGGPITNSSEEKKREKEGRAYASHIPD